MALDFQVNLFEITINVEFSYALDFVNTTLHLNKVAKVQAFYGNESIYHFLHFPH
jgi:hypothetical protein